MSDTCLSTLTTVHVTNSNVSELTDDVVIYSSPFLWLLIYVERGEEVSTDEFHIIRVRFIEFLICKASGVLGFESLKIHLLIFLSCSFMNHNFKKS